MQIKTASYAFAIAAAVLSAVYTLVQLRRDCQSTPLFECVLHAVGLGNSKSPNRTATRDDQSELRNAQEKARQDALAISEKYRIEREEAERRAAVAEAARKAAVEKRLTDEARRKADETEQALADTNRSAAETKLKAITGVSRGTYLCNQGISGLTLTIDGQPQRLSAVFDFYPTSSHPNVASGKFRMSGIYNEGTRQIVLQPGDWIYNPNNALLVSIRAEVDLMNGSLQGAIIGTLPGCSWLKLSR